VCCKWYYEANPSCPTKGNEAAEFSVTPEYWLSFPIGKFAGSIYADARIVGRSLLCVSRKLDRMSAPERAFMHARHILPSNGKLILAIAVDALAHWGLKAEPLGVQPPSGSVPSLAGGIVWSALTRTQTLAVGV
jgi:hypothetical protein